MIEVRVPDEQEGTKAVVRAWLKQVGDAVSVNDPLVELETDKVTQEVPSPGAGVLAEILLDTDAEAVPGALLGRISSDSVRPERRPEAEVEGRSAQTSEERPSTSLRTNEVGEGPAETRLSPSVRRACLQHGIDASRIQGTGRNGRVTREDVDRAVSDATVVSVGDPATAQPRQFSAHDIPHERMRVTIAENMVRAVSEAPHVTAVFEADFSAVAAHKGAMAMKGVRLSYTAYIVKAAAEAMAIAPAINGRWEKDRIAISPTIDIGVGTALGKKGLVVPVVKDCGKLSLEQIGAKLDDLTRRARDGKLERSDVAGGSFTISNHGVSGSLLAAPIILHQGQAAILGVGKLEKRVIVREIGGQDAMLIRPMAYVTLTIDHRVVDGHQTNAWLTRFVEILEKLAGGLMVRKADDADDSLFIRRVLIVLGLTTLFILAWQLRTLLLMFFGAIVVATVFRAFSDKLERLVGGRPAVAVILSITLILGAILGLIALFGSHVLEQVQLLRKTLPAAWHAFEARMGDLGLGEQIKGVAQSIQAPGGSSFSAFGRTILSIGSGIADVLVVIVAGIFLATQPRFYMTGAVKLIPPVRRALALEAISESEKALRLWLRGQLIAMVVVGLLTGIGLWALGMPSALTLGLLAGVLEFIPFAGPILSMIPAVLLALAVSPDLAFWVLLLYFAVQQFEGYVLTPLVQQYAVDLPGVVLLFSLIAFGALFGTLGVILAAPLTVVTYVLIKRLYVIETLHTPTPIPGETKT